MHHSLHELVVAKVSMSRSGPSFRINEGPCVAAEFSQRSTTVDLRYSCRKRARRWHRAVRVPVRLVRRRTSLYRSMSKEVSLCSSPSSPLSSSHPSHRELLSRCEKGQTAKGPLTRSQSDSQQGWQNRTSCSFSVDRIKARESTAG